MHVLHGLKIEGTAPDELTFTFDPYSSPEGQSFMIYNNGRKVFAPAAEPDEALSPVRPDRFWNRRTTGSESLGLRQSALFSYTHTQN